MKPEHLRIYKEIGSRGIADRCAIWMTDTMVRDWKNGRCRKKYRADHIEETIDKFIYERAEKRRRLYENYTQYAQFRQ